MEFGQINKYFTNQNLRCGGGSWGDGGNMSIMHMVSIVDKTFESLVVYS